MAVKVPSARRAAAAACDLGAGAAAVAVDRRPSCRAAQPAGHAHPGAGAALPVSTSLRISLGAGELWPATIARWRNCGQRGGRGVAAHASERCRPSGPRRVYQPLAGTDLDRLAGVADARHPAQPHAPADQGVTSVSTIARVRNSGGGSNGAGGVVGEAVWNVQFGAEAGARRGHDHQPVVIGRGRRRPGHAERRRDRARRRRHRGRQRGRTVGRRRAPYSKP